MVGKDFALRRSESYGSLVKIMIIQRPTFGIVSTDHDTQFSKQSRLSPLAKQERTTLDSLTSEGVRQVGPALSMV